MQEIKIKNNDVNKRLDNFLRKIYPFLPLSLIYKSIRKKNIKVNNKKSKEDYLLKLNDVIQIYLPDDILKKKKIKDDFVKSNKPIDIIYEDENILVVNKPVNLLTHSDEKTLSDTLINRVKNYLFRNGEWKPETENQFAPALINRIDRNTSGLVLIAKNIKALQVLNEKMKNKEIQKTYYAKVHGLFKNKEGLLENYLTKNAKDNIVKITDTPINRNSKFIQTKYKVISENNNSSLLKINLITGKTHQIRAHFKYIGHPLFGDKKYSLSEYKDSKKHQALVSSEICFKFKDDAGNLNYLNNKIIKLKSKPNFF